jgi:hypothetical protein
MPQVSIGLFINTMKDHEGLVVSANNNNKNSSSEPVGAKYSGNESSDSYNKSSSRRLRPGTQVNPQFNPQWVKGEYDKILTAFNIQLDFSIRTDRPSRQFDLLENPDRGFLMVKIPPKYRQK